MKRLLIACALALSAEASQASMITFDDLTGPDSAAGLSPTTITEGDVTFGGGVILTNVPALTGDHSSVYSLSSDMAGLTPFNATCQCYGITVTFPIRQNWPNEVLYNMEPFTQVFVALDNQHNGASFAVAPNATVVPWYLTADNLFGLGVQGTTFTLIAVDSPEFNFALENVCYSPACGLAPLPGGLPLFATGLGLLGLLGWRQRKVRARAHFLGPSFVLSSRREAVLLPRP